MYASPEEKHPEQRAFSMVIYIFAGLGALVQYAESLAMNIAGFAFLALVGFMVKAQKLTAKDTIYASHVAWVERTISIATNFLFPISVAFILYFIFKWTDIRDTALANTNGKNTEIMIGIVKSYIDRNQSKINTIVSWSITPPIIWWLRRCWYGFQRAKKSEPIDFPDSLI